ncbi:hypothetical protein KJ656_04875 [bacterium]|nr:hypothetical protein [bacterium]
MQFVKPVVLTLRQINKNDTTFDVFVYQPVVDNLSFLQNQILVQPAENGYRIVYGFDFLQTDYQDDDRIVTYVIPGSLDVLSVLALIIKIQINKRALYPVEVGKLLSVAKTYNISDDDILHRLFPEIKITARNKLIEQYKSTTSIQAALREYLIQKNAPLKTWLLFADLNDPERKQIGKFIAKFRPTLSVLEEIMLYLSEIKTRDRKDLAAVLKDLNWEKYFQAGDIALKDSLAQLRTAVFQKRYPQLSIHKNSIDSDIKKLDLPNNATLSYDESFEKKELTLQWRLRTSKDLKRLQQLGDDMTIQKIRQIMDKL